MHLEQIVMDSQQQRILLEFQKLSLKTPFIKSTGSAMAN